MKANKMTLTVILAGVLGMALTAQAGPGFAGKHTAHLNGLRTSGSAGGDKIDRKASVGITRMGAHWASLQKSGSAPGDKVDRTVKAVQPRQAFELAPVK